MAGEANGPVDESIATMWGRKVGKANRSRKAKAASKPPVAPVPPKRTIPEQVPAVPALRPPEALRPPTKRSNSLSATGPTITDEAKQKSREELLRTTMLNRLADIDQRKRADEIWWNQKIGSETGAKATKLKKAREQMLKNATDDSAEFERQAARILGVKPVNDIREGEQTWMPVDTSKKGGKYRPADFFGSWNSAGSGRFQGGYRDPAFREKFIEGRMKGLTPGDAGYDRAFTAAQSAWTKAEASYDKRFRDYGNALLRDQQRKERQLRRNEAEQAPQNPKVGQAVPGSDADRLNRRIEKVIASGIDAESIRLTEGSVSATVRPRANATRELPVGARVGREGRYAGGGTIEFFTPSYRRELEEKRGIV